MLRRVFTVGGRCRDVLVREAMAQTNDINLDPEVRDTHPTFTRLDMTNEDFGHQL
mgnify:CR=1 FL=1